jgi:phage-related tail protein
MTVTEIKRKPKTQRPPAFTARQVMEKITKRADAILEKFTNLDEEKVRKDGWLILKACSELRHILETELRICETLYNAEAVAKWQELLLTILGKVAPDARDEFYRIYQDSLPIR